MNLILVRRATLLFCSVFVLIASPIAAQQSEGPIPAAVDQVHGYLLDKIEYKPVVEKLVIVIDHHRLAKKAGVSMPPAVATIFSDPEINTPLIQSNPRIGLDLPFKYLVYAGEDDAAIAYASSEFLSKRHGVDNKEALANYQNECDKIIKVKESIVHPVKTEAVTKNFGIIELVSDYSYDETIDRIKKAVMSQGDTVWFGSVDYKSNAKKLSVDIQPASLLLFGGPGPGGKAMAQFPRLGLDAFCQKLLVYEDKDGSVKVLFNDIVALAKLHYGKSNQPQKIINQRLKATFSKAIKK